MTKLSELTERECAFCGDRFMPVHPKQVFDTADCRYRATRQKRFEQRQADKAKAAAK